MEERRFQHYTRKQRAIAWISRTFFDRITYTVRHGLLRGMKRKGGLGWIPERFSGSLATPESQFWEEIRLDGAVVYDIGAFHGLLTLFFARRAAKVVSYEPVLENRARLLENIALNRIENVTVRDVAIGASARTGVMRFDPLTPGFSKVILPENGQGALGGGQIRVTTLDQDILEQGLPVPEFIKIDIEGFELDALRGARQTLTARHPALFIELHGETLPEKKRNAAAVVDLLHELGYAHVRHIESGIEIRPGQTDSAAQGHLYCLGATVPTSPRS
jgi:FkbM family methyltransferase